MRTKTDVIKKIINTKKNDKDKLNDKHIITFTKKWMNRFFWLFCIWVSLSYILAFIGKEQIAETLSSNVVQFGIAAVLGYLLKSFFETRSEELLKFKREMGYTDSDEDEQI